MATKNQSAAVSKTVRTGSGNQTKRRTSAGRNQTQVKKAVVSSGKRSSSGSISRTGVSRNTKSHPSARRKTGARSQKTDYSIFYEILMWLVIAAAVLMQISIFGVGGSVGRSVCDFLFGSFGLMAYPFPFLMFLACAFLIANPGSRKARRKIWGAVLVFLSICGAFQLIFIGYRPTVPDLNTYFDIGNELRTGGGVCGGAITHFLCPYIGVAGCVIILIIVLMIGLVILTERTLLRLLAGKGQALSRTAIDHRQARIEWARETARERESLKNDRRRELQERRSRRASAAGEEAIPEDEVLPVTLSLLPRKNTQKNASDEAPGRTLTAKRVSAANGQTLQVLSLDPLNTPEERASAGRSQRNKAQREANDAGMKTDSDPGQTRKAKSAASRADDFTGSYDDLDGLVIHTSAADTVRRMPDPELPNEADAEGAWSGSVREETASARRTRQKAKSAGPADAGEARVPAEQETKAERPARASRSQIQEGVDHVREEIEQNSSAGAREYIPPSVKLLRGAPRARSGSDTAELRETAAKLQQIFKTFGVNVKVTDVTSGPSVTRYELMPEMGVKVSKIVNLQDDIKLNLAAADIRIEAPIPGKAAVGIEVPNKEKAVVFLRELLESDEFQKHPSSLCYVVGKDIAGSIIVSDIAKMPHLLIAGSTGAGKSVFINTLIMSILFKSKPDDVKLIMIDPKVVELSVYNGIPHLYIPVVTDPKKASGALNWAVVEMDRRYETFAAYKVRDINGYNKRVEALNDIEDDEKPEKMPRIVVIVDELADLMMVCGSEVEDAICRLAQKARAAGIHLVLATQRPSVDVITGLIKANMPSRIAFAVSSGVDSRTILDMTGAERLLGNGDMLFSPSNFKHPLRVQGAFISDEEVADIAAFVRENNQTEGYGKVMEERLDTISKASSSQAGSGSDVDELFYQAGMMVSEKDTVSIGMLQRYFKIGFNRASRIMEQLSEAGVVSPENGTKPRKVLMSREQFENYQEQQ